MDPFFSGLEELDDPVVGFLPLSCWESPDREFPKLKEDWILDKIESEGFELELPSEPLADDAPPRITQNHAKS